MKENKIGIGVPPLTDMHLDIYEFENEDKIRQIGTKTDPQNLGSQDLNRQRIYVYIYI